MKLYHSAIYLVVMVVTLLMLYRTSYDNPPVFDDNPTYQNFTKGDVSCHWCDTLVSTVKQHYHETVAIKTAWNSRISLGVTFGDNLQCNRKFNVLLGILVGIAGFFYISYLFKTLPYDKYNITLLAILASVCFIFNPASVYAVAYLVQRTTIVATLFSILAVLVYIIGLNGKYEIERIAYFIGALLLYKAAFLGKQHSEVLPAVMFVHYLFYYNKIKYSKVFYIAEGLLFYGGLFYICLHFLSFSGLYSEPHEREAVVLYKQLTGVDIGPHLGFYSAMTQCKFYFIYLMHWIFPAGLAIDLKYPILTSLKQSYWFVLYALYPILPTYWLFKKGAKSLLGLGLLIPYAFFILEIHCQSRIAEQFVLYRSYLWMCGFFAVIPFFVERFSPQTIKRIILIVFVIFAFGYRYRLNTFENEKALWFDTFQKLPIEKIDQVWGSNHAINSLGKAYYFDGEIDKSLQMYDLALSIDGTYTTAISNKAVSLIAKKDFKQAKELLLRAKELNGNEMATILNLGAVEIGLGNIGAAEEYYKQLPDNLYAKFNLAKLYFELGACDQALPYAEAVIDKLPNAAKIIRVCKKQNETKKN